MRKGSTDIGETTKVDGTEEDTAEEETACEEADKEDLAKEAVKAKEPDKPKTTETDAKKGTQVALPFKKGDTIMVLYAEREESVAGEVVKVRNAHMVKVMLPSISFTDMK